MAIRLRNSQLGGEYVEKDRSIENSILERTIRSYENDRLNRVRDNAFYNCDRLQSIDLPIVSYIGSNAFRSCPQLQSVNLPNANYIGNSAFMYCTSLPSINLSNASYIGSYVFENCRSLQSVNLPNASYIGSYTFRRCNILLSLYLSGASVCSLAASNVFNSTPIAGYTTSTGGIYGSIFVPASLYSNYITATNWTVFSSRFVSI